jgi:hypothetical protein
MHRKREILYMSEKPIKIKVVQKQNADEIPIEIIAQSIKEIADGFQKIMAGKLNRRALVLLLKDASGQGAGAIEDVLAGLESLKRRYLK